MGHKDTDMNRWDSHESNSVPFYDQIMQLKVGVCVLWENF